MSGEDPHPRELIPIIDGLVAQGLEQSEAGEHRSALETFRQVAEMGEERVWLNIGNEYYAQGILTEAVESFQRALRAGEWDAAFNLARTLEDLGDLAGAMSNYRLAAKHGDTKGLVMLAFLYRQVDEHDRAMEIMREAAALKDEYADAVSATWEWDKDPKVALEERLRRGAKLYPSARAALGMLLASSGRIGAAVEILQVGLANDEVESSIVLGNVYQDSLGDLANAEMAFRHGARRGDPHSKFNLGRILERTGRPSEAAGLFREAAASGDELSRRRLQAITDTPEGQAED